MHKNFVNKYYFIDNFDIKNIENLDKRTSVIYRNYSSNVNSHEILIFRKICKKRNIKFYLSNNLKLAIKLNCDGVYIPSFNKYTFTKGINFKKNFDILGSAHNLREIRHKELQGVKTIFISSIFKKNKNYLGLHRFKTLKRFTKKRIVGLGGINKNNLKYLKILELENFAGISYFKKKPPQWNCGGFMYFKLQTN